MAGDEVPETEFARLGDDQIAYPAFGEGDIDLVFVSQSGDPIDLRWDLPSYAIFLRRLAGHAKEEQGRIIAFLLGHGANPTDADAKGKTVAAAASSDWIRDLLGAP